MRTEQTIEIETSKIQRAGSLKVSVRNIACPAGTSYEIVRESGSRKSRGKSLSIPRPGHKVYRGFLASTENCEHDSRRVRHRV
jgi:hypothetical protein